MPGLAGHSPDYRGVKIVTGVFVALTLLSGTMIAKVRRETAPGTRTAFNLGTTRASGNAAAHVRETFPKNGVSP